jgi:catechol 2,3-dioxygenase-like lactoylglutathione lyase family enzyme
MKRSLILLAVMIGCLPLAAQDKPKRPRITGIDHVRLYVTNIEKSREFYNKFLGLYESNWRCTGVSRPCFAVSWGPFQHVELEQAPLDGRKNLLAEVAFDTDNLSQMRLYLLAQGLKVGPISKNPWGVTHFRLRDPEGNSIAFVGHSGPIPIDDPPLPLPPGRRVIHAGFVVHDRTVEDHFFKDILGFHLYWQGGMKDDESSWVAMQVSDGTDWVEYMLNISPDVDKHTLGVMNHLALGVKDIHVAEQQLIKNGWKPGEAPKMGRDGKWQLNLYDPDDTRVEFMEFKPVEKPCCSEFTGPHPGPTQ